MAYRNFKVSLLLSLLLAINITNAQKSLPTIACICELEALIIQSKTSDQELILEETENGLTYEFVAKEIEVPKQELKLPEAKKEEDIKKKSSIEKTSIENKRKNKLKLRKASNRKKKQMRKKRKIKRAKLKRKKYKKYKGDCPTW